MTPDRNAGDHQALLEALRHPLRRDLLKLLIQHEEISPVDASRLLKANLSNVSYHMRKLADRGLARLDHTEQARGAAVHFYVPDPAVEQLPWVREAIGLPPAGSG